MPSDAGRIRRKIVEINIGMIFFRSFESIGSIVLVRDQKVRNNSMVFTGSLGIVYIDPDEKDSAWLTNDPPDGTAPFHNGTGIRTKNFFSAHN